MAKKERISASALRSKIRADFVRSFKLESRSDYNFQFRASGLPFCSRAFVIDHRYNDVRPTRPFGYKFNFYVDIGTAVHEVIQKFLGMGKVLYGDWTCCGVTDHRRIGSVDCPVCGKPQLYGELAPKSVLGMHVDGISVKYNAVLEFKTTSSRNLKALKGPYPNHMVQASCYLHALNAENSWELDKLVFVYFSRDNPADFRIFVCLPKWEAHDSAVAQLEEAKKSLKLGVLPERECASTFDGSWRGCPYMGVCFKDTDSYLSPVEPV